MLQGRAVWRIWLLAGLCLACLVVFDGGWRYALAWNDRLEASVVYRCLAWRDLREPTSFTPSAAYVPQYGGWTRNWTERRVYAGFAWKLCDADALIVAAGGHLGTSTGFFEARNVGIGYYEAWETRPALLWGPNARLLLRQGPRSGLFLRLDYELFVASAAEAREEIANRMGGGTPASSRDAVFSWTSHEATALVGHDWGRTAIAIGGTLTVFRLDKRLDHHIDPAGTTGNALAAILALNAQPSRYGYEPRIQIVPCLALTFRPTPRLSLETLLRPGDTVDATLRIVLSF